jgi:hypothetical protein
MEVEVRHDDGQAENPPWIPPREESEAIHAVLQV